MTQALNIAFIRFEGSGTTIAFLIEKPKVEIKLEKAETAAQVATDNTYGEIRTLLQKLPKEEQE